MKLVIRKSNKCLEVWEENRPVKTYPVATGKQEGHKELEGDLRTPEGDYIVCVKNPRSKYHLSLGLNYPNNLDAQAGLKKGRITESEYRAICEANNAGKIPPWKTVLGGEIYIHGHLEKQNWTHGCIRMNDPDIEELFKLAAVGTKVTILP